MEQTPGADIRRHEGGHGSAAQSSRRVPLDVQIESREETPDYVRFKLTYVPEPGDRVPAILLVPKSVQTPADEGIGIATTGRGYDGRGREAAGDALPASDESRRQGPTGGLVGEATRHYGHQLAQRGFVCLIPDYPSFGDYKAYDFKQKAARHRPAALRQRHDEGDLEQHPGGRSARIARLRRRRADRRDRPFARRAQRPLHGRLRAADQGGRRRVAASTPSTTTTRGT